MVLLATALSAALAAPAEPPPEPKYAPAGHRWRFSWLASWEAFITTRPNIGTSISGFLGAGYPVPLRRKGLFQEAHAFGYWPMIGTTSGFLFHQHRLGVAGHVSRPRRLGAVQRRIGLFYQAGAGVMGTSADYVLATMGGRVGLALGRLGRPSWLMTLGGDIEIPRNENDLDPSMTAATFVFSLVGVGWL